MSEILSEHSVAIGMEHGDGTIVSIFCSKNGMPENLGKILIEHFSNREKVEKLVNSGNLKYISSSGKKYSFKEGMADSFLPYELFSTREFFVLFYPVIHFYLFDKSNLWLYLEKTNYDNVFTPLKNFIENR